MDRFKELTTFVDVAKLGSLSAAARAEGVTPAMAGRRIDQLEARLGVKLFQRSTRKMTLTDEGHTFLDDVTRIMGELSEAEECLSIGARGAVGRLIVCTPTAFGRKHVAPHLPQFHAENPNLCVTLRTSERIVDLKNERVDLAIRIADLKNADLVAVKLAANHRVVCATPGYFKRHGKPTNTTDLAKHPCLITATEDGLADQWVFQKDNVIESVKVSGPLHCNDGGVLTEWALAGHGLAWRSAWEVAEEVRRGRLATCLDEFATDGNNIYAVYASRRHLPARVRLFIDFLKRVYGPKPEWES